VYWSGSTTSTPHCARTLAASAPTLSKIESGGPGRLYRTEDLEGHRWMFLARD
jgi:hypothetical protein